MGYDEIKSMLNTMRTLNESKNRKNNLLSESEESETTEPLNPNATEEQFNDVIAVNDVDVKLVSTDKEDIQLKDTEKTGISQLVDSFRQEVSQLANLEPGFVITETQIRLDGSIDDLEVNFVYIVGEDSGLYINSDMLKIELETIEMLNKLLKFEQTFSTSMEPLVRTRMN